MLFTNKLTLNLLIVTTLCTMPAGQSNGPSCGKCKSIINSPSPETRYHWPRNEAKSLSNEKPAVTEIKPKAGVLFGIVEAYDGKIWFGTTKGVYRYDGNTLNDFNDNH